jgi:nitrogen fixation NifU-like protein
MTQFGWYSEKVLDHYQNPRNMGKIEDADGVGVVGNPVCGDMMMITIKVRDNHIKDIKFKTFGCGAAIATTSMVTELVRGKTIERALQVTNQDVADALDGLPPIKMHCSLLAEEAIKATIEDYREKSQGTDIEDGDAGKHK